jgi:hypothetical protein
MDGDAGMSPFEAFTDGLGPTGEWVQWAFILAGVGIALWVASKFVVWLWWWCMFLTSGDGSHRGRSGWGGNN